MHEVIFLIMQTVCAIYCLYLGAFDDLYNIYDLDQRSNDLDPRSIDPSKNCYVIH